MRTRLVAILFISFFLLQGCNEQVIGGPTEVLVVRNANSPVSIRIASYYMSKRGISAKYGAAIRTIDSSLSAENESITGRLYETYL